MNQSVKPDFFSNFRSLRNEEIAKKAGLTQEELDYFHLGKTAGWKHFEKLKDRLLKELDLMNDSAISNGIPVEEIGKNAIIISLTKGIISRLFNKVKDAQEAAEKKK